MNKPKDSVLLTCDGSLPLGYYPEAELVEYAPAAPLMARIAELEAALGALHHAVCDETGFAECVRRDSGTAYPWPALDAADELTRRALAKEPTP